MTALTEAAAVRVEWYRTLARCLRAGARGERRDGRAGHARALVAEAARLERQAAAIVARQAAGGVSHGVGEVQR